MQDEFYIGWMPKAPDRQAKYIRNIIVMMAMLIAGAAIVLALSQRQFSTATFEYGKLTEVKGIYQRFPVPSLKVHAAQDISGRNDYITMPLVGYGKFGASGLIAALEEEHHLNLDNKEIRVKGTLLYSDGKSLLQLDQHDHPLLSVDSAIHHVPIVIKELGNYKLSGEILDPKCFFGVMKPGEGKPHRDCAARCIAGGINPVFRTVSENGETSYFILLDEQGEPLNEMVKNHVGEPVTLNARAMQADDWTILYVDKASIKRSNRLGWSKPGAALISCGRR